MNLACPRSQNRMKQIRNTNNLPINSHDRHQVVDGSIHHLLLLLLLLLPWRTKKREREEKRKRKKRVRYCCFLRYLFLFSIIAVQPISVWGLCIAPEGAWEEEWKKEREREREKKETYDFLNRISKKNTGGNHVWSVTSFDACRARGNNAYQLSSDAFFLFFFFVCSSSASSRQRIRNYRPENVPLVILEKHSSRDWTIFS